MLPDEPEEEHHQVFLHPFCRTKPAGTGDANCPGMSGYPGRRTVEYAWSGSPGVHL